MIRASSWSRENGSIIPCMADWQFSRRNFFYGSLLAGAVPAGGFGSGPSLPQVGYKSPNEKLNIPSVGAGGQAGVGISSFTRLQENIVALCDPDAARAAAAFQAPEKAPKYTDFRKMLEKEEKKNEERRVGK